MAEYRPYRITNKRAQLRLTQLKLVSVSTFIGLAVLINWMITQNAARLFGYSRVLGPSLIGSLYAPWEWTRVVVALACSGAVGAGLGALPP